MASDVFFFNDTATTEIYTLSLHDALPIFRRGIFNGHRQPTRMGGQILAEAASRVVVTVALLAAGLGVAAPAIAIVLADRKSTRLNSSHANISYAVFCLKKKKPTARHPRRE